MSELPLRNQFNNLVLEFGYRIDHPPEGDPVLKAWNTVAHRNAIENPAWQTLMEMQVARDPFQAASHSANLLYKNMQALFIDPQLRIYWGFPQRFRNERLWEALFNRITAQPDSPLARQYRHNIRYGELNANVETRGVTYALTKGALPHRFDGDGLILDIGAAQNLVLKQHSLRYPYSSITVVNEWGGEADDEKGQLFNRRIAEGNCLAYGLGVEVHPIVTEEEKLHAKNYSFNPGEFDVGQPEGSREETYDLLVDAEPENVELLPGDFTFLDEEVLAPLEHRFDMATISFSGYQNITRFPQMLQNALRCVKRTGLILVQDFMDITPEQTLTPRFLENWYIAPGLCKVALLDVSDLRSGLQTILEGESGRLRKLRVSPKLGETALAEEIRSGLGLPTDYNAA